MYRREDVERFEMWELRQAAAWEWQENQFAKTLCITSRLSLLSRIIYNDVLALAAYVWIITDMRMMVIEVISNYHFDLSKHDSPFVHITMQGGEHVPEIDW